MIRKLFRILLKGGFQKILKYKSKTLQLKNGTKQEKSAFLCGICGKLLSKMIKTMFFLTS